MEEEKLFVFFQSIIMIPYKKIRGFNRTPQFVEDQYDKIAGSYIHDSITVMPLDTVWLKTKFEKSRLERI